jgi:hypothetical protein
MVPKFALHKIKLASYVISILLLSSRFCWGSVPDIKVDEIKVLAIDPKISCEFDCSSIEKTFLQFDIKEYDALNNGSTFKNHINADLSSIAQHVEYRKSFYINGSYYNAEVASHVIRNSIIINQDRICKWMKFKDASRFLRLEYNTSHSIGRYLKLVKSNQTLEAPILSSKVMVLLRKNRSKCSFTIVQSHPI